MSKGGIVVEGIYQKLYAFLLGEIDRAISMIELEKGNTPDAMLLRRVSVVLETALSEAEERYILASEMSGGINYRCLYDTLKIGIRAAMTQQFTAIMRDEVTKETMFDSYKELAAILEETDREFQEELQK